MTDSYHSSNIEEVFSSLKSRPNGLNGEEAQDRLKKYGYNELKKEKRATALQVFLRQFKNIFMIILIVGIVLSVGIGFFEAQSTGGSPFSLETYVDAIAIGAIVIINSVVGFVQEYRSEKAMEAMKELAASKARVLRNGVEEMIPAREVALGDILLVEAGDCIAADARLIEAKDLEMMEAVLTGESTPVDKDTRVLPAKTPLAERSNMVFTSTCASSGRGKAIVTSVGMNTEFGKIAEMVQVAREEEIPLKRRLDHFAKRLGILVGVVTVAILLLSVFRTGTLNTEMLLTAVALAVSAVPEGLPAIVTVTLALGAKELSKKKSLIRRLASVETLGSTTVICSDKTGTLTKGEMTARKIFVNNQQIRVTGSGYEPGGEFYVGDKKINPADDQALELLLRIGSLNNNAAYNSGKIIGDPTEGALIVVAAKAGIEQEKIKTQYPRVDEIPFSSQRKLMTTVHKTPEQSLVAYVKGSPEKVLELSKFVYADGKEVELTEKTKTRIKQEIEQMANEALRVLGMAYKKSAKGTQNIEIENLEKDLVFVGLIGLIDPPRPEAKEAVRLCEKGGIKVTMITGDHKNTAVAIAKELGIMKSGKALDGEELDKTSDEELAKTIQDFSVFARVTAEHKVRIIKALKKQGHIVAMTGDGVNDAPALKQADIGVAMGITGTDVTKEASDMVLMDDNFATIVNAVKGGRVIYQNIRKFVRFLLALNFTELILVGSFAFIGLPIPLLPAMILWLNLVTDGPPAVALSVDPPAEDVMQRPPRSPKEGILHGMVTFIIASTLIKLSAVIIAFWWGLTIVGSLETARTMVFLVTCFFELVVVWNCRSESRNAFRVSFLSNKFLVAGVAISILSTLAVVFIPALQVLFQTVSLGSSEWALTILLALSGFLVVPEVFMKRKKR